jgi:hypothetical protein
MRKEVVQSNGWKITAIIFIVISVILLLLLIFVSVIFIGIMAIGYDVIAAENECSVNVCRGEGIGALAYIYDDQTGMCYCIDSEGETVLEKYIR